MLTDSAMAFRAGFLTKCAEHGLSVSESLELAQLLNTRLKSGLKKLADGGAASVAGAAAKKVTPWPVKALTSGLGAVGDVGSAGIDAAMAAAGKLSPWAIAALLLGPPAAGYVAGQGLAGLSDYDDTDVYEIQKQELADEYRRNAAGMAMAKH